jgi:hypothetical protein
LKKYIKSNRSKENRDISYNSAPKSKFNESNNLSDKTSPNKYANTIVENNNHMTINSVSNTNDSNNTINLLPLHISSNPNSPIDMIKNKSTSSKKDNKIFLLNLNLNINKNNTMNIKIIYLIQRIVFLRKKMMITIFLLILREMHFIILLVNSKAEEIILILKIKKVILILINFLHQISIIIYQKKFLFP